MRTFVIAAAFGIALGAGPLQAGHPAVSGADPTHAPSAARHSLVAAPAVSSVQVIP